MTNRYVVRGCEWHYYGKLVQGWEVYDRDTGRRAKGTEPSQTKATVWRLKDKMNAALDKANKKQK